MINTDISTDFIADTITLNYTVNSSPVAVYSFDNHKITLPNIVSPLVFTMVDYRPAFYTLHMFIRYIELLEGKSAWGDWILQQTSACKVKVIEQNTNSSKIHKVYIDNVLALDLTFESHTGTIIVASHPSLSNIAIIDFYYYLLLTNDFLKGL